VIELEWKRIVQEGKIQLKEDGSMIGKERELHP